MANARPLKHKNGTVYAYQLQVYRGRDVNGKQLKHYTKVWRIPESMTNSRSIAKALEREKAAFENECKAGLVSSEHKTFAEYADYVMQLKERDQKHRTVCRYRELLARINPEIGHIKIADLTGEHLNRFYIKLAQPGQNKRTGGGLSAKTITEHHRLIHTILAQARKENILRFNVAESATPPSVRKTEAEFFEIEEVNKIIDSLSQEPLKWQCITQLLIASGARRGEIMGLKWTSIDWRENQIKISASILYAPDRGIYEDTTKTNNVRYVTIDPSVMELLKMHRNSQYRAQLAAGSRWEGEGYCFTQDNGKPMHPDSITDWLAKFSKKYNLPHVNPHKFRHTQASILIAAGVDPVTVSKRLGHSQVSTTQNIYAHMVAKADAEASQTIASVLYKKKA